MHSINMKIEILNVTSTLIFPSKELQDLRHILFILLVPFRVEEGFANFWLELCEKEVRDEVAEHNRSLKSILRT